MTILAIRHAAHEGLGILEKIFAEEKVPYRYVDVFKEPDTSADLSRASALVVMGGPMGVYETDRFPFLEREIGILKEALRRKIPTLGVCLGSQLLAAAAGARVFKGPRKEIGWFPVQMKPEASRDPLFRHCPSEIMVFHWHGDTFEFPSAGARRAVPLLLASSDLYSNQAFRLGESAWGLQFHLEITEEMIKEWLRESEERSKTASPDWNACEILTQTPCFLPEMEALAGKVFREFVSLAKSAATR